MSLAVYTLGYSVYAIECVLILYAFVISRRKGALHMVLHTFGQSQSINWREKNPWNHRTHEKLQHINLCCKVLIQNIVHPVPDYHLFKSIIVEFCIPSSNSFYCYCTFCLQLILFHYRSSLEFPGFFSLTGKGS